MTETAVQEKPILFSGAMVRAILEGRKTQTRRVCALQDDKDYKHGGAMWTELQKLDRCPYGKPGTHLWVRETWAKNNNQLSDHHSDVSVVYRADSESRALDNGTELPWKPSIHMPRSYSRISLEIVSVKVERVQDISEADAIAEGCTSVPFEQWYSGKKPMIDGSSPRQECRGLPPDTWTDIEKLNAYDPLAHTAKEDFQKLWDSINSDRGFGWEKNPWVWAIEFKRLAEVTDAH